MSNVGKISELSVETLFEMCSIDICVSNYK